MTVAIARALVARLGSPQNLASSRSESASCSVRVIGKGAPVLFLRGPQMLLSQPVPS